ncbi:MAG TPA: hypothetical protein VMR98_02035 [Candidatus Polarisedimenticolaceae bacterium]|nr:hypothetical protein [Candidatus Polarisedimenticolaceae bacterium]
MHNFRDELYSLNNENLFQDYVRAGKESLQRLLINKDEARFATGQYSKEAFYSLIEEYSVLPGQPQPPVQQVQKMAKDLFAGVPRYKSPQLLYNVGTAVNEAAAALYALGLDESILYINDGLAGNTLVAEHAVVNIVGHLAGVKTKPYGIFTFGGTATNLYGMKIGLKKAFPASSRKGIPENVRVFAAEDAHFSHDASADWLGIGTERIVVVRAGEDRTTDLKDLEHKLRSALKAGCRVGAIVINGGTTYSHTIDPIAEIADLRDGLVKEFSLDYKPHIHVDTVIGWAWLFFKDYDWVHNVLRLDEDVLEGLKFQYERIKELYRADSWGIDFHKGVGSCPIACSLVVINDFKDAMLLSRKQSTGIDIHQLAAEHSFESPVDYTLETTRMSGPPLAALAALRTLGSLGYQSNLANLVGQTMYMKKQLVKRGRLLIANPKSVGFATALRLVPPGMPVVASSEEFLDSSPAMKERSDRITDYTEQFFNWDYETRIKMGKGPEYSYSSGYAVMPSGAKLGIIKLYPVSPFFDRHYSEETVNTIVQRQAAFDGIWLKRHKATVNV